MRPWSWSMVVACPPHLVLVGFMVPLVVATCFAVGAVVLLSIRAYGWKLRSGNRLRRVALLKGLGIDTDDVVLAGFFHPFCNAGGGGERVLWTAIAYVQRTEKNVVCVVYTGDAVTVTKEDMVAKVKSRFDIALDPTTLAFVPLRKRHLVEDAAWPRFTLIGQSVGSVLLVLEGLSKGVVPDIFIDTMGYAFTYPIVRHVCRIPVSSYTHYPTISTDMLRRVQSRQAGHTNRSVVASSFILSTFKLLYYFLFAEMYSACLRQADVLMVNSTWTANHINHLLKPFGHRDDDTIQKHRGEAQVNGDRSTLRQRRASREGKLTTTVTSSQSLKNRSKEARIVYPPCDTLSLASLPVEVRERLIVSLAQFRPEKEHQVQLEAFALLLAGHPEYRIGARQVKLVLAGSVRNKGDEDRVESLKLLSRQLGIEDNVSFIVNSSYADLVALLGRASVGLHTMVDEHFGITVVEFQAAGLVPVVHASAGPLLDIVVPNEQGLVTGYHATSIQGFADRLEEIFGLDDRDDGDQRQLVRELRLRARENAVRRFSVDQFERGWSEAWRRLLMETG